MLMLSVDGVRKWAESGELHALTTPGGHRRYLLTDVQEFAARKSTILSTPIEQKLMLLIVDDKLLVETLFEVFSKYKSTLEVDKAYNGFSSGRKVTTFKPDVI